MLIAVLFGAFWIDPSAAGPGHDHGDGGHVGDQAAPTGTRPRKLPDGAVFVPKPTQRLLEVRTQPAAVVTSKRSREWIGTVVPDPSFFGQVQAPMEGQIEVGDRGISFVGQKVQAGEVLALLAPSIPVADLGTMQQLRAEVDGKLIIAEQKLDRLSRIADVVAKSRSKTPRRNSPRCASRSASSHQKTPRRSSQSTRRRHHFGCQRPRGQVVSARDTLFEIVDPEKLWVEAIGDAGHGDGTIASATAVDSEGHSLPLGYVGRSPTLRQQSRPFLFRIEGAHSELVIGAPIKVIVRSAATAEGIELPAAAVARGSNGIPQVWIKEGPERFRPAEVKTQPWMATASWSSPD